MPTCFKIKFVKIEFENSIRRLSFLCHLTDIKIAWINPCIVAYRTQLEAAQLKNLFFLAVLKLDVKDSFGYNKKNWKNEKQSKKFIYKLSIYFININITLNLKMKKQMLYCCFTWKVFTELNFAVVFLLIRKTWEDPFACEVGGWGILRNRGGDLSNDGDDFEMGGIDTPLQTISYTFDHMCLKKLLYK